MIDFSPLAVPHTLDRLLPVLPPAPARVVEVGCGRGALAAALAGEGYQVTGVDPDEESCAAAAARGVNVVCADIRQVPADLRCDVLLFTRSLHHVEDLAATVADALALLEPGGLVVLEEFDRERADHASAGFVYDARALLVATGALALPDPADPPPPGHAHHAVHHGHHPHHGTGAADPNEDPLARWEQERGRDSDSPLHTGAQMVDALTRAGARIESNVDTEALWRMVLAPGSQWLLDNSRAAELLTYARTIERRRISEQTLRAVGMFVVARTQDGSTTTP